MDDANLTSGQTNKILLAIIGALLSIIAIIFVSGHLLYYYFEFRHIASSLSSSSNNINAKILLFQLLGYFGYFVICISYCFFRNNLLYGGVNNSLNYQPSTTQPFNWLFMYIFYAYGKVCVDISWMIRVYAIFKVM